MRDKIAAEIPHLRRFARGLARDRVIAGTGTIDGLGSVGAVGGVQEKVAAAERSGATVFLVPAANCDEARTDGGQGLDLIKVDTLRSAVDGLGELNRGRRPPTC